MLTLTGFAAFPIIASDVAALVGSLRRPSVSISRGPGPADRNAEVTDARNRESEGNVILLASA